MTGQTEQKKLTQQQAIAVERDLAKFANTMDSLVRIPFTKQGVGADAALSTIPFAGDIAGFILTMYAFKKAKEMTMDQSMVICLSGRGDKDVNTIADYLDGKGYLN